MVDIDKHHRHTFTHSSVAPTQTPTPTVAGMAKRTIAALARRATCGPKDDSPECEKPVHDNSLAIGLGVGIPIFFVIVLLTFLHFRHVKKLKREEEANSHIDINDDLDFEPTNLKALHQSQSAYTLNSDIEKSQKLSQSSQQQQHQQNQRGVQDPTNPFTPFQYNVPEFSSSQRSLNNISPYDLSAYPPTASVYETPSYPPSVHTRSSSPVSNLTNPYSSETSYNFPPTRALNHTLSNSSLNQSYPQVPHLSMSKGSSALSTVSSHTPTVESVSSDFRPDSARIEHSAHASIDTTFNASDSDSEFHGHEMDSSKRKDTDITIPDENNTLDQINLKLNQDFHDLEVENLQSHSIYSQPGANRTSEFSFVEPEPSVESADEFDFDSLRFSHTTLDPIPMAVAYEKHVNNPRSSLTLDLSRDSAPLVQQQDLATPSSPSSATPPTLDVPPVPSSPRDTKETGHDDSDKNTAKPHVGVESTKAPVAGLIVKPIQKSVHPLQIVQNFGENFESEPIHTPHGSEATPSSYKSSPSSRRVASSQSNSSPVASSYTSPPTTPKSHIPLPQLQALPTPHMLDDTSSTISYASSHQRKTQSPIPQAVPIYNSVSAGALPSPSQIRHSVSLVPTNYETPKKFSRPGSRSNSRQGMAGSPDLRVHGSYGAGAAGQRPPSELVPDPKSQFQKLRPQMDMSAK